MHSTTVNVQAAIYFIRFVCRARSRRELISPCMEISPYRPCVVAAIVVVVAMLDVAVDKPYRDVCGMHLDEQTSSFTISANERVSGGKVALLKGGLNLPSMLPPPAPSLCHFLPLSPPSLVFFTARDHLIPLPPPRALFPVNSPGFAWQAGIGARSPNSTNERNSIPVDCLLSLIFGTYRTR